MNDRNLLKGLFIVAVALGFGIPSLRYPMGSIDNAGPGLFPLVMASVLLLIGAGVLVRSRLVERADFTFRVRNIGLVMASLGAFALVTTYINMIAGIVALVVIASFASGAQSLWFNVKVSLGLIAVGFAFQKLLGLQLPLY